MYLRYNRTVYSFFVVDYCINGVRRTTFIDCAVNVGIVLGTISLPPMRPTNIAWANNNTINVTAYTLVLFWNTFE